MSDDTQAPEQSDNVEVDEAAEVSWQEQAGLSGNASFEKFATVGDLAKSYSSLEAYNSRSIQIPTEDASDEARNAFMEKLTAVDGVMATPENYYVPDAAEKYTFSEVEGFTGDESVGELKAEALKLGMTQDQANGIHNWLASNIVANQTETASVNMSGMAELKGIWGAAYDQKIQQTENTVSTLAQKIPGLVNAERTPEFVRLMDLVGDMLGEAGVVQQDPRTQMTPAEARQRIAEIESNTEHPAHPDNEGARNHLQARKDLMGLYRTANM
ncbi:MAG: hypothetical protein GY703_21510 [Gammaproteobacteria bacterium]|nr:hypothetical protein [Gammaproteobacteria bacterium]